MSVYVDDMLRPATVGRTRACWSHLMADTSDELAQIAHELGLRPEWIQHPGTHREHYDVTTVRRQDAIALGAVEISYPRGTAEILARKRRRLGSGPFTSAQLRRPDLHRGAPMTGLHLVPVDFRTARDFIEAWHRHHKPPVGPQVQRRRGSEPGTSVRAAGWRIVGERPARAGWDMPSRPRDGDSYLSTSRTLWEAPA